ncbi:MAG: tetratricopeptide repeat protein [Candidatus Hodarchaeota archaeon]
MTFAHLKERIKSGDSLRLEEIVSFGQWIIAISRRVPDYYEIDDFGHFIEAIEKGERILYDSAILAPIEQQKCLSTFFTAKGTILFKLGNLDNSLELLKESVNLSKALGDKQRLADIYLFLGDVYGVMGDRSLSIKYYEKSLRLFETISRDFDYPFALNHIAVWFGYLGEMNYSLEYFRRALDVSKGVKLKMGEAISLQGIGWFYQTIGELDKALSYFHKCLEVAEKAKPDKDGFFQEFLLWPLQNMGWVYQTKGDFSAAVDFYERSLAISQERNNALAMAWNLYYLVTLALNFNSLERAKKHLEQLAVLNTKIGAISTINAIYNLSKALVLRASSLSDERTKAYALLNEVIGAEFPQQKIKVHAMLALCELLLSELAISFDKTPHNEILLARLRKLSGKLQDIAKHQTSSLLQAESSFLQAQLARIDLDFVKAQELLNQAQTIAEEKGFHHLGEKITAECKRILKKGGTAFHILLLLLTYQEMSLRELSESLFISKTAVLRHLRLLILMDLVRVSREEQVRSKQIKAKHYMLGSAAIRLFQSLSINLWHVAHESEKYTLTLSELLDSYQMASKLWKNLSDLVTASLEGPSLQEIIIEEDMQLLRNRLTKHDEIKICQYALNDAQYEVYLQLWKEFTEKVEKNVLQRHFFNESRSERTKHIFHVSLPLQILLEINRMKKRKEKI